MDTHDLDDDNKSNKRFRRRQRSRDARENRTVFIKNLSFDSSKETLEEILSKFGKLEYCVLCYDKEFAQPKGTAFAKYINKEDAETCIEEASKENDIFILDGRKIEVQLALTRGQVKRAIEKRKLTNRDKRNLYLAKEGVIYPNSLGAKNVSKADLKKRLMLEIRKRKFLENLHNFISPYRLCIHNLPENLTDQDLKKIVIEAINDEKAIIKECKIIRDLNRDGSLGKSKGFGFISLSRHEHALKTLRILNNNPDIFTSQKRPIVEFSIENLSAVKKKAQSSNITTDKYLIAPFLDNYEEESYDFMGLKSRRFRENENVCPPKINRKIYEHLKSTNRPTKKQPKKQPKKNSKKQPKKSSKKSIK